MWSRICISGETFAFYLRIFDEEKKILVMMFDKKNLWREELSMQVFSHRCKDYNPTLEFSDSSTLSLIKKTLGLLADESDNVKKVIDKNACDLRIVCLETRLGGVPFKFQLHLKLVQNLTTVHDEVLTPLFLYIRDLEVKQRFLIDAIKKKDVEINEYKMQGARLSRKNAETHAFNEEQFFHERNRNIGEEFDKLLSFVNATKLSMTITTEIDLSKQMSNNIPASNSNEAAVQSSSSQELASSEEQAFPDPSQARPAPKASQQCNEKTNVQETTSLENGLGDQSLQIKRKKVKNNRDRNNILNL